MPTYNSRDRKDFLIRQIREAIAEENRKDIIERLWKGRQERVRRGLPPGGNLAYGYRRDGHRVIIDEAEAAAVTSIFERTANGESRAAIARYSTRRVACGAMALNGRRGKYQPFSAAVAYTAPVHSATVRRLAPMRQS